MQLIGAVGATPVGPANADPTKTPLGLRNIGLASMSRSLVSFAKTFRQSVTVTVKRVLPGLGTVNAVRMNGLASARKSCGQPGVRLGPVAEMQFSMPDQWSRHLFVALYRRYGLKPYRYHLQRPLPCWCARPSLRRAGLVARISTTSTAGTQGVVSRPPRW
jgi:hypothetical protein